MAYRHSEGEKVIKRVVHRLIPYLILYEAIFASWLYFNNRPVLTTSWSLFALGLGSLISLALLEHRQNASLPFMNHLGAKDFLLLFVLALGGPILIMVLGRIAVTALTSSSYYYDIAWFANVGILEESYKVALTNLVAIPFQWAFREKRSERLNRVILYTVGSAIVAFWVWRHDYPIKIAVLVFLSGMLYFGLIVWKRNYLPVVLAHISYDLIVFFPTYVSLMM
jgi:hypothetical protein